MKSSPLFSTLLLAVSLSACAPVVNSQSGQASSRYVPPPAPAPVEVSQPASGAATKVALLLPLSGPQAALGQGLLNAAQLAIYDVGDESFALLPEDTQGTPAGATTAAQQAIRDGAQLFIGPVFGPEVQAIRTVARSSNIPTLALTNNEDIADNFTYVMGLSPQDQVGRVLGYAKKQGLVRIAALLPSTPYGDAIYNALTLEAATQGISLLRTDRYDSTTNLTALAQQFMANINGAQAVFFGETGQGMLNLATALGASGYNPTALRPLGPGLWDDGSATRSPVLAGGWYAAPAGTQRRAFNARYMQTFGSAAPGIAPLAYDSAALAAVLARSPEKFSESRMTEITGFNGVDGIFRLTQNGDVERGLAVFEVAPGGNHVIDAAPLAFSSVPTN